MENSFHENRSVGLVLTFIGGMVDWLGLASNAPIDGDGLDGLRVYVIDLIYNFGDVYH